MNNQILHKDYTSFGGSFQVSLPLNFEFQIERDDPVRLLLHCIQQMDLTPLYRSFRRAERNLVSPHQLLAILIYAYMNQIYSSRRIEEVCLRDIHFMYLLEGRPAPDHTTIARFRRDHFAPCAKEILAQMAQFLASVGAISFENLFVDGTKIEAVAGKYTFVWKKGVAKNRTKLMEKLDTFLAGVEKEFGIHLRRGSEIRLHHLKRLRRRLKRIQREQTIIFVYGSGKRKTVLQRTMETLDSYISRLKDYTKKLHICGDRNSFSKTDYEATFMRMKEDAMKNGQLKPAYNLQYGVEVSFIVWAGVYQNTTDTRTLIPFLEDFQEYIGTRSRNIIADAGYESEENYLYLRDKGQASYIKPNNYEISKKRKWKNDIGRRENMVYLAGEDVYLCAEGKCLSAVGTRRTKSAGGYISEKTLYACAACRGCERKGQCIHGNHSKIPLQERVKRLEVSKVFQREREENLARIRSTEGILLRMNRSIQVEGAFAQIKENFGFRRFLTRGQESVLGEAILLALAHNVLRLHEKIQRDTVGRHLIALKEAG